MKTYQKLIALALISVLGLFAFSCKKDAPPATESGSGTGIGSASGNTVVNSAEANTPPPANNNTIETQPSYAQSPTEAYKGLYEAVKAKDTEKIKSYLTQKTLAFGAAMAAQRKITPAEMYANGFTATNFAEKLPEIRDQRVKDNMGAVEVYNQQDKKWEDLPFIFEDGGWKLAVGDEFADTYKSPGKGKAQIEMEASNKTLGSGQNPAPAGINAPKPMPSVK